MQRIQGRLAAWLQGQPSTAAVAGSLNVTEEAVRRWKRREGFPSAEVLFKLHTRHGVDLNKLAQGREL
jgi:uncharacterized protein YjcR